MSSGWLADGCCWVLKRACRHAVYDSISANQMFILISCEMKPNNCLEWLSVEIAYDCLNCCQVTWKIGKCGVFGRYILYNVGYLSHAYINQHSSGRQYSRMCENA